MAASGGGKIDDGEDSQPWLGDYVTHLPRYGDRNPSKCEMRPYLILSNGFEPSERHGISKAVGC